MELIMITSRIPPNILTVLVVPLSATTCAVLWVYEPTNGVTVTV